jgi:quercetin dioxygenase-like cupin family protein
MNIACRMVCASLGAVLLLAFLSNQAIPQDPVKVAPDVAKTSAPRDISREYEDEDKSAANPEPLIMAGTDRMLTASLASLRWQKLMPELGVASPEGAFLCANQDTNAAQIIYRQVKNAHHPKHWHTANASVVVLSGRMTVKTDKTVDLGPGDFLYVPRETVIETWTPADQGCMLLVTTDGPCGAKWVDHTPTATEVIGAVAERSGSEHHVVMRSGELQWNDAPPSLPPGAKMAVLAGDPNNPQPFTMRIRVPAGYRVPPHRHPADENVTVISGSLVMGMGDELNTESGQALSAGDFVMMPAGMHHFAFAQEETTVEIHGIGPWGITYVNPADDPRNNKVTQSD